MQPNTLMDQPQKSNANKHSYGSTRFTILEVMQPNIVLDLISCNATKYLTYYARMNFSKAYKHFYNNHKKVAQW